MSRLRDSEYYLEEAERCLRWASLLNDRRSIAELEALAGEYLETARRLQSTERAPFRERVPAD